MDRAFAFYWDIMDRTEPEIWPGSTPWSDRWGSFGTLPDAAGFGAMVERTRVPADDLPGLWRDLQSRCTTRPRFRVGPRETPGLDVWLSQAGYCLERRETVMVWDLATEFTASISAVVCEVRSMADLAQVIRLDHGVFGDPLLDAEGLAREWGRLGPQRRLYYVPGEDGTALSAGGVTVFSRWALLWGGETHPDHRHRGLYHQVLAARLQSLHPESTRFAAVVADDATSMPILTRLGFRAVGHATVWAPGTSRSGGET